MKQIFLTVLTLSALCACLCTTAQAAVEPLFTNSFDEANGTRQFEHSDPRHNKTFWPTPVRVSRTNPSAASGYSPLSKEVKPRAIKSNAKIAKPAAIKKAVPSLSFNPNPFLLVRTGVRYPTLRAALDSPARSGDTIKVAPGTYVVKTSDDVGSLAYVMGGLNHGILVEKLTIEWEVPGNPPLLDISQWAAGSNALGGDAHGIVMGKTCTQLTIRGINLKGYRGSYALNSGVYILSGYGSANDAAPAAKLTVEYSKIYEFTNGILTRPNYRFSLYSHYNIYQDNGNGDGLSHGVYVSDNLYAEFIGDTFKTTTNSKPQPGLGHLIKSRAKTTLVKGSLFDPAHGTATDMDFANGGNITVTGNIVLRYGAAQFSDDNPAIKFGEEQTPGHNANSPNFKGGTDNFAHDGRSHSILVAQNTFRIAQPEGGPPFNVINITTPVNESSQPMPVALTIRNNIAASDNATAANFIAAYPNNSAVAYGTVADTGVYSGGVIAGNPAVNDANYSFAGERTPPHKRNDTSRGGLRIATNLPVNRKNPSAKSAKATSKLPLWVPTALWKWTDIPGTAFNNYMKNDGTGIAPPAEYEPGGSTYPLYAKLTSFGGPAYSRKNHELWMFGGGHAATTLNPLVKWNLNKDSPDMTLLATPTPAAIRKANWNGEYVNNASGGYWPDGKPMAAHAYRNNQYLDSIDEFVSIGLSAIPSPTLGATGFGVVPGFQRNGKSWRPAGYWPNVPSTGTYHDNGDTTDAVAFTDWVGATVYYYNDKAGEVGWRKLDAASRKHTTFGKFGFGWWRKARAAARHDQAKALIIGGELSGWQAKILDLTTGSMIDQRMAGANYPPEALQDISWVPTGPTRGYWVAWFLTPQDDGQPISSQRLMKIELTGTNQLTATEITTTGTPLVNSGGNMRGMYYDDLFGCLIFIGGLSENLKALKPDVNLAVSPVSSRKRSFSQRNKLIE